MAKIRFDSFGGQIPALDERLLPIENAVYAENAFLQSGRLEPLSADIEIHVLAEPTARFAFRVPKNDPGLDSIENSYWLEFQNANTTVVRSPVEALADGGRFYWANTSTPPGYTTRQRLEQGLPPLLLGVPRPMVPPGVTVTGGAPPTGTRAYTYTWQTISGEEGQPAPPTLESGNFSGTWGITLTPPDALQMADRTLAYTNIYRTEVATDGETVEFFFVDRVPIATTTYTDVIPGDQVAAGRILASEDWAAPPEDLAGLVSMANGMIVGWRKNEVWFCEPYRPHAWPTKYTVNVEFPIVGIGTIDQTAMVLTAGQPYAVTGIHPSVMALRQVQPIEPCTAQGSIVSTPQGVLYTSNNGLILIGSAGAKNITFDIIRKDEWLRLLNLNEVHATYFMNGYYVYSGTVDGAFQEGSFQGNAFQFDELNPIVVGAHISLGSERLGYMTLTAPSVTHNVMLDGWTGETLVLRNGRVYHVDRREYQPRQSYKWKSKIVQTSYKQNWAAVRIFFNKPIGGPPSEPTVFRFYANNEGSPDVVLKHSKTLTVSGEQFRLPSGFRPDFVQFSLEGQMMIYNMQVATSAHELREV